MPRAVVLHVHGPAESNVVGDVPTLVIRIVVEDDFIRCPEPVIAAAPFPGCDPEVVAARPEAVTRAVPTAEAIDMIAANPASEAAVLEGVIQVESRIDISRTVRTPRKGRSRWNDRAARWSEHAWRLCAQRGLNARRRCAGREWRAHGRGKARRRGSVNRLHSWRRGHASGTGSTSRRRAVRCRDTARVSAMRLGPSAHGEQ